MKLNFKGFFKAAGLCSLAFALTGCITWGLVSNTASRPHAEQWRSDTIKGLSLAEDSNGTKGYVFVGESLDYLLTTGGGEVVKMLNDPAIHGERITVSDNAKFILSSSDTNFSGSTSSVSKNFFIPSSTQSYPAVVPDFVLDSPYSS